MAETSSTATAGATSRTWSVKKRSLRAISSHRLTCITTILRRLQGIAGSLPVHCSSN